MSGSWEIGSVVAVSALVIVIAWYLASTAGRIDRLHIRLDAARASLDLNLAHRAEVVAELLAAPDLDPVSRHLLHAALTARRAADAEQLAAEGELSEVLREIAAANDGTLADAALQEQVRSACARVAHAQAFYNEAVAATLHVRRHTIPRLLGLAGHTPYPEPVDFDDEPPVLVAPDGQYGSAS